MRTAREAVISVHGTTLRHVCPSEAEELLESGKAVRKCRKCKRSSLKGRCLLGGGEHQPSLYLKAPERRESASPCAISARESLVNVGIAGGPMEPPNDAAIKAAQAKVRAWPEVYDLKAMNTRIPLQIDVTEFGQFEAYRA